MGTQHSIEQDKPVPGTIEFYDAVCTRLNPSDTRGYIAWKEEAERIAGVPLDVITVYLYALCGKAAYSLSSWSESDEIEEAIDSVLSQ